MNNFQKLLSFFWIVILLLTGVISYKVGFSQAGGNVTPMTQEEVSRIEKESAFQYIPSNVDLTFALESGHYLYCVSYPGIGIAFSGYDEQKNLIVSESPRTYPAFSADILAGMKVLTSLEILQGDLNTPVKVEFQSGTEKKSKILKRVLVKKCLKKESREAVPQDWIEKNKGKFEL